METPRKDMRSLMRFSLSLAGLLSGVCLSAESSPCILLTNLPAYGTTGNLGGLALDAGPSAAVAAFIYVPGAGWWSKPTCAAPLTLPGSDGRWSTDITTGGTDPLATRVAAVLLTTNYNEPCLQGSATLPTNLFAQAAAAAVVTRPNSGGRWLTFSGYDWRVKTSTGPVGPGPNYFSDSTNNVWVDETGQLHLRVTHRTNQWQCAEVVSGRTFGYGQYRFEMNSRVDNLDPNIVLGLFTWSDDPVFAHREIDIECSRWGNPADLNNAQFVIQPYNLPGHLLRYAVPANLSHSTHLFTWQTSKVSFQCQRGAFSPAPGTNLLNTWTYTLTTPQSGDENVRFNLWLNGGKAPVNGQETEVVIKSFVFVPLGQPYPTTLTNPVSAAPGHTRFEFDAQPDRRYQVQSSADLSEWQNLAVLLATNPVIGFTDTNPAVGPMRFFRTQTLP